MSRRRLLVLSARARVMGAMLRVTVMREGRRKEISVPVEEAVGGA